MVELDTSAQREVARTTCDPYLAAAMWGCCVGIVCVPERAVSRPGDEDCLHAESRTTIDTCLY